MATATSNRTGKIELRLTAYNNCDDVELFWRSTVNGEADAAIPNVIGFMLERQRKLPDAIWGKTEVLRNRVGFTDSPEPGNPDHDVLSKPSNVWPFQCYNWTDHGANNGQTVRYRVSAMCLPAGGQIGEATLQSVVDSGWTAPIVLTANLSNGISVYFNRGAVMSQYVARVARIDGWKATEIKDHVKELREPLRQFLSGELRVALLELLDTAIADPSLELYAALYELSDPELIDRLKTLGDRAHVILANGSDRSGDGNEKARGQLKEAGVDVYDRLLKSKGLGHNKFAALARRQDATPLGVALRAWTGSTNWATTGLCTQLNNGIQFDNEQVAGLYLDQWSRLKEAQSDFPPALVQANAQSPRSAHGIDIWFSRVRNKSRKNTGLGIDLQALIDLVNGAQESVLYVMFQPGPEPLTSILQKSPQCFVRGVVSTVTSKAEESFQLAGVNDKTYHTALVQPEGIGKDFNWWIEEVTRNQFLYPIQNPGVGHAITHAKMIVIDALTENCVVVTGSHNFSAAASEENDENFVVIKGNRALAEAYAVACLSIYQHYRWRAYLKDMSDQGKDPWGHLSTSPAWQQAYLSAERRATLQLWCPMIDA